MVTHFSILAWKIPWTEEPRRLQFIGSQRVGPDWSDLAYTHCREPERSLDGHLSGRRQRWSNLTGRARSRACLERGPQRSRNWWMEREPLLLFGLNQKWKIWVFPMCSEIEKIKSKLLKWFKNIYELLYYSLFLLILSILQWQCLSLPFG